VQVTGVSAAELSAVHAGGGNAEDVLVGKLSKVRWDITERTRCANRAMTAVASAGLEAIRSRACLTVNSGEIRPRFFHFLNSSGGNRQSS
jgi:hypothetical protein